MNSQNSLSTKYTLNGSDNFQIISQSAFSFTDIDIPSSSTSKKLHKEEKLKKKLLLLKSLNK